MAGYSIVSVDARNVDRHGLFCVNNRKHPGYVAKRAWLEQRFAEGLRIKLLLAADRRQAGFIEYVPGKFSWRAVEAPDYLVIHCIWVKPKRLPQRGGASALLEDCAADAAASGMLGVAAVTSDGPWMAGPSLFTKNGFALADEAPPHYQLMVRQGAAGPLPRFPRDWETRLGRHKGLRLLYASQCPYIAKAALELPAVAEQHGIRLELVELDSPDAARSLVPSPYGVFSLVHEGRLLADHAISATRFRNILQKDLGLTPLDHPA